MKSDFIGICTLGEDARVGVHPSTDELTLELGPVRVTVRTQQAAVLSELLHDRVAEQRRQRTLMAADIIAASPFGPIRSGIVRTRTPAEEYVASGGRSLTDPQWESSAQADWDDQHRGDHAGRPGTEWIDDPDSTRGRHRMGVTYIGGKPGTSDQPYDGTFLGSTS